MTQLLPGFVRVCSMMPADQPQHFCTMRLGDACGAEVVLTVHFEGATLQFPSQSTVSTDQRSYWLEFNFNTIFIVLRRLNSDKKCYFGEPIGIKFEAQGYPGDLTLYDTSNPDAVGRLVGILSNFLAKRGLEQEVGLYGKIGTGQSAKVYSGFRMTTKEHVAVKCVSKQGSSGDDRSLKAIRNEITVLRHLDHPNLMKMFEVYETTHHYYLVCELLAGGSLENYRKTHSLTFLEVRELLRSISKGVRHMHSQGFIHRDLKPQNIVLRKTGEINAVIADFGLATQADLDEYIYVRCGTPGFIAPEIIYHSGRAGQTTTSDIFSLGVVAHILAVGKNPFIGRNCHETLNKNNAAFLKLTNEEYKSVNPLLLDFIVRTVERDPSRRLSSSQLLNDPLFTATDFPLLKKIGHETIETTTSLRYKPNQTDCLQYKPDVILISDSITILTPEEAEYERAKKKKSNRKRPREVTAQKREIGESPRKRLHKIKQLEVSQKTVDAPKKNASITTIMIQ